MRAVGFIATIAATFLGAASPDSAQAQTDYPSRPVSLIVPYAAGGVADVAMRLLGDKLSNRFGQQFVIENRPGAGGIVAAQTAAAAVGDGYTLLMTGNNTAIAAALFKSLPYNVLTDFASISTAAFFDLLVVTRAGSPLHSIKDMIAAALASAGPIRTAYLPHVPTVIESRLKDYKVTSWNGLSATAATPARIIASL